MKLSWLVFACVVGSGCNCGFVPVNEGTGGGGVGGGGVGGGGAGGGGVGGGGVGGGGGGVGGGGAGGGGVGGGGAGGGGVGGGGVGGGGAGGGGGGGAGGGGVGGGGGGGGVGGGGGAGGGMGDGGFDDCSRGFNAGPSNSDTIRVQGQAGHFGSVDYTMWGSSAGASSPVGIQRFTGANSSIGLPAGVFDTGLWVWSNPYNSAIAAVTGQLYTGNNIDQYNGTGPFVNFRIAAEKYLGCPAGAGTGSFTFVRFGAPPSASMPIDGTYSFQCPDAGINVTGCFHYP